jgi:hypothetical protein
MRTLLAWLSVLVSSTALAQPARIDAIMKPWTGTATPGCAVGVVQQGKTTHARGYGMADLERRVPITPTTLFDIGSTSKQFTAANILMLAAEVFRLGQSPFRLELAGTAPTRTVSLRTAGHPRLHGHAQRPARHRVRAALTGHERLRRPGRQLTGCPALVGNEPVRQTRVARDCKQRCVDLCNGSFSVADARRSRGRAHRLQGLRLRTQEGSTAHSRPAPSPRAMTISIIATVI